MTINEIKQLIDDNIPADLDIYAPEDIDKNVLGAIQFVLSEISFAVDKAVDQQQKQFLMS